LLAVFVLTLIGDAALSEAFAMPWLLLWLVAVAGMLAGVGGIVVGRLGATSAGRGAAERTLSWALVPSLVLVGVLALRAAVIFSAQV
jgi:hypothetical protein